MAEKKLLIVQVAALGHELVSSCKGTASLGLTFRPMETVFPALTCTVQASFRTGLRPEGHGMAANGIYERMLNRPFFWEQSSRLVEGERIWKSWRARGKRVGLLFWQQSLGEEADVIVSPAPIHKHGGGMIQDYYAQPAGLYERLVEKVGGRFNLMHYWGPMASTKAGDWIAKATAALMGNAELAPELLMVYLPTLDYDLQRYGPEHARSKRAAKIAFGQLGLMTTTAKKQGYDVVIFGDYAIGTVTGEPVFPNRALLEAKLFATRSVQGRLYPDFHRSRAFAMVDHEVGHVYVRDAGDVEAARKTLEAMPGIDEVLDRSQQKARGVGHARSGELVITAKEGTWLAYPWWEWSGEGPDYARHVDIHNKPGYDPCELFFGRFPWHTGEDACRIKGSHGRTGKDRLATWGATVDLGEPATLIELSAAVKGHLG